MNADLWHLADGEKQQLRDEGLRKGLSDFESYKWLWSTGFDMAPSP
jgi:hypothetical protein